MTRRVHAGITATTEPTSHVQLPGLPIAHASTPHCSCELPAPLLTCPCTHGGYCPVPLVKPPYSHLIFYSRRVPFLPVSDALSSSSLRMNIILLPVDQRYNSSSEEMMKTEFSEVKNCRNERHCPWGRGCLGVYPPLLTRRALPGDHWTADRLGALRHFDASTLRHEKAPTSTAQAPGSPAQRYSNLDYRNTGSTRPSTAAQSTTGTRPL